MKATRICSVPDCSRTDLRSRNLCTSHYVQALAAERPPRTCAVEGCDKRLAETSTRKVCETHYRRMRVHGSYDEPTRTFQKDQTCSLEDCRKQAQNKGLCGMHAERLRKNGDPSVVKLVMGDPERRFWAKVDKSGDCWLWTGWTNENGYGQFSENGGEKWAAHRYSYTLAYGPIPPDLTIDHVYANGCRHRHCVRPEHLEAVTQTENNRRALEAKRARLSMD